MALASLTLVLSLVRRDYSLTYVANQVSNTQPLFYNISSFWGGQAGSLLFWTLVLAGYSVAVTLAQWKRQPVLRPYVTAVLLGVLLFFLSVGDLRRQPVQPSVADARRQHAPRPCLRRPERSLLSSPTAAASTRSCRTTGW